MTLGLVGGAKDKNAEGDPSDVSLTAKRTQSGDHGQKTHAPLPHAHLGWTRQSALGRAAGASSEGEGAGAGSSDCRGVAAAQVQKPEVWGPRARGRLLK